MAPGIRSPPAAGLQISPSPTQPTSSTGNSSSMTTAVRQTPCQLWATGSTWYVKATLCPFAPLLSIFLPPHSDSISSPALDLPQYMGPRCQPTRRRHLHHVLLRNCHRLARWPPPLRRRSNGRHHPGSLRSAQLLAHLSAFSRRGYRCFGLQGLAAKGLRLGPQSVAVQRLGLEWQ